jgi:hypothetical protein
VQDNTVDANVDPAIDKSNPFQIGVQQIEVNFGPRSIARFNGGPKLVSLYLTVVPKTADISEISTINSVTGHGGFVLGAAAVGFPGH